MNWGFYGLVLFSVISGAHPPDLTPEQLEMSSSRLCAVLGKALGVVVGCLIGKRRKGKL